ncbi:MAG TPA: YsnF/AvaK domain-containing protein [Thermomicrobiales bacterium]|nr:YsnF/AvaK domain-containing protein [Thermomicrobiales bacterium]
MPADKARNERWIETTTTSTAGSTLGYDTAPATSTQQTTIDQVVAHEHDVDRLSVPVVEEELTARTRSVERGQVHVETRVSKRERPLEVPVTEERVRVRVNRVAVNREATAVDLSADGATIDLPIYGEEVEIDKRARVVEEVQISKDAVQETRTVSDTVRREDVDVIEGVIDLSNEMAAKI